MERVFNKKTLILTIVLVLVFSCIATISLAKTKAKGPEFSELKEGDILSFSENYATGWNVYTKKKYAANPEKYKSTVRKWLQTGDKIVINEKSTKYPNVLQVDIYTKKDEKNGSGYIYYGPTASTYFKLVGSKTDNSKMYFTETVVSVNNGHKGTINFASKLMNSKTNKKETREIEWKVEKFKETDIKATEIATIEKKTGEVTINTKGKLGTIKVVATVKGTNISAYCRLTVLSNKDKIDDLKISLESDPTMEKEINVNETFDIKKEYNLTVNVEGNSTKKINKTITWTSSNPAVAKVSQAGKVKGLKPGPVTITATLRIATTSDATQEMKDDLKKEDSKLSKKFTIIVRTPTIENFPEEPMTIEKDTQIKNVKTKNPEGLKITWSSSNNAVAKVDQNGKITAVSNGTATITASLNKTYNVSKSCEVTVKMPATGIEFEGLTGENLEITKKLNGNTYKKIVAKIIPEGTKGKISWEITQDKDVIEKYGTVKNKNEHSIKIKAIGEGTATLTASVDGTTIKKSITVTVKNEKDNEANITKFLTFYSQPMGSNNLTKIMSLAYSSVVKNDGETIDINSERYVMPTVDNTNLEDTKTFEIKNVKWTLNNDNIKLIEMEGDMAQLIPLKTGKTILKATIKYIGEDNKEHETTLTVTINVKRTVQVYMNYVDVDIINGNSQQGKKYDNDDLKKVQSLKAKDNRIITMTYMFYRFDKEEDLYIVYQKPDGTRESIKLEEDTSIEFNNSSVEIRKLVDDGGLMMNWYIDSTTTKGKYKFIVKIVKKGGNVDNSKDLITQGVIGIKIK